MEISILRLVKSQTKPTIGVLSLDGVPICLTLELPWLDNRPSVSCIPEGDYMMRRTYDRVIGSGTRIAETFEIVNVPGRSGILIHIGNFPADTQGCVLPGMTFSKKGDCVLNSGTAFRLLLEKTAGVNEIELYIEWAPSA